MRPLRRSAAILTLFALVAAACSRGHDETTSTTATSTTAPPPTSISTTSTTTTTAPPVTTTTTSLPPPPDTAALDSVDPVLSARMGTVVRVPNSTSAVDGRPVLQVGDLEMTPLVEAVSATGHPITSVHDPLQDLELAMAELAATATEAGDRPLGNLAAADEMIDILTGETQGRVYDGFALLNYNRGAWADGHMPGEYKMKRLRDSGDTIVSHIDGQTHKVWELDINMLWYGQNFDSDTFLVRVPFEAHPFDELRINWQVYSLIQEDLAPTTILNDGFGRIFHGLDSTFLSLPAEHLSEVTIAYPSLQHFRGLYIWGWGVHPPRVQFLQPVAEIDQAGDLNPAGLSFATRTREDLTIDAISDAAPEKKAYKVAIAALGGATGNEIAAMLTDHDTPPAGTFREWIRLAADLRQLPPEAWDVLRAEDGLGVGEFGDYDIVLAYMNNEIYGATPYAQEGSEGKSGVVTDWNQGDAFTVKVINLDDIVHYYRNVDFSEPLNHENEAAFGNGAFSFDKFNPKPTYGVPKVAEMQWRTGWGYVPHLGIQQQEGVFPRDADREMIVPFTGQLGKTWYGYLFQGPSGYWRFNPPEPIREGEGLPAGDPLRDGDGADGVLIGTDTEGFGVAHMPQGPITTHPDRENFPELNFPGFLRNPAPGGGDIIPPTPVWAPFLALNPQTGTLRAPDGAWWVDYTYFHGRPIPGGSSIVARVEAPRAGAQLFYQFDPLFHDNMIFSYHPRADSLG